MRDKGRCSAKEVRALKEIKKRIVEPEYLP
jgi:hypothetical protein